MINAIGGVLGGIAGGLVAAATGQSIAAGVLSGAISGVGLGGGYLINAAFGVASGLAGYFADPGECGPSIKGVVRAAGLGAISGILGRQLGFSNAMAVAKSGQGAGQVLGQSGAVASGYYAQSVGGGIAGGAISAAAQ